MAFFTFYNEILLLYFDGSKNKSCLLLALHSLPSIVSDVNTETLTFHDLCKGTYNFSVYIMEHTIHKLYLSH